MKQREEKNERRGKGNKRREIGMGCEKGRRERGRWKGKKIKVRKGDVQMTAPKRKAKKWRIREERKGVGKMKGRGKGKE